MAINSEKLLKIVSGIFNAAPGSNYLAELEAFPGTESAFAQEMVATSIFTDSLGGATTPAEIGVVLAGNFGLTADDVEGSPATQAIAFFTDGLTAGANAGDLVLEAVNFLAGSSLAPEFAETATLLTNKAAVSAAYSAAKGSTDLSVLQASLSTVTGTAVLTTAEVDAIVAAAAGDDVVVTPVPGDSFTLTTSADALIGTANDDTFTGLAATNTVNGNLQDTAQSVDSINGGDGTDTANLQIGSAAATVTLGANISNVEIFNITGFGGTTNTLNMSGIDSATTVNSVSSVGPVLLTNVGNVIDLGLTGTKAALTATFLDAGIAATTDASKLSLSGANGKQAVTLNNTAAGTIETLTVDSSGNANDITLAGSALTTTETLNVTGSSDLKMTTTALTGFKTVDGSAAAGNLTLDVSSVTAQNMTVTTGTGDDKITMAGLTDKDTVDGGDGTDILSARLTASVSTAAAVTNVEELQLQSSAAFSFNAEKVTGLTKLTLNPLVADVANLVSVTNAAATLTDVVISGTGITTAQTNAGASVALKTSTGTTDALTVTVDNVTATGVHTKKADATVQTVTALTANGIETLTLKTADLGANTVSGSTTTVGGLSLTTLTDNALKTLNIESDTHVVIGSALGATTKTVDASATTAGVNLNIGTMADSTASGTASTTVTTGSGDDTLGTLGTVANVNMTVSTGAGKDTLTIATNAGTAGIVTLSMGDGDDTVTGAATTASNTAAGKAGSTLDFGAGTDTLKSGAGDTNLTSYTISNLEKVQLLGALDLNVNAADFSGKAVEVSTFNTGYLELVGTTGADTIDASTFTINGTNGVHIKGGNGADTITGSTGADTFKYDEGNGAVATAGAFTAQDTIASFNADADKLGANGVATSVILNGAAAAQADGTAFTATATTAFDFNGAVGGAFITGATAASLLSEANVIAAIGATANETVAEEAYFAVVNTAGTEVGLYHVVSATADNAITAGEIELLGVATYTGTLTAADVVFQG